MYEPAEFVGNELEAMQIARMSFMATCPFYCHLYYGEMKEFPTRSISTLATDGRTLFFNPTYMAGLKVPERVFALAHEVEHTVCRHPQRANYYRALGNVNGVPFDHDVANKAMDYVVNASLAEQGVGAFNKDWLYDPNVDGDSLWEDVYARIYKQEKGNKGKTFGDADKAAKGAKGDPATAASGGAFDALLPPPTDPVTGRVDEISEPELKEAVARALSAAKAMGTVSARIQRLAGAILEPQVDWREHVRLLVTGKLGHRRETWDRPNRRRLVLNPIIITPGRAGHGAGTVACVIDNSGSISEKEISAYFAEIGAILADVRPKQVVLIFCDAKVRKVASASSLDELADVRAKGSPGGGGTSFIPPFDHLAKEQIRPDALIYLTDMMGTFPAEKPSYDVIWCATTDRVAPWGETVRVKV